MSGHLHSLASGSFGDSTDRTSFICDHIHKYQLPILRVCHDYNGDWQFLCGGGHSESEPIVVCLGCALERDESLLKLSDLPKGWGAERPAPGEAWSWAALPPEEEVADDA